MNGFKSGHAVEAREIGIPLSISKEAQDFLALSFEMPPFPPLADVAAWDRMIEQVNLSFAPAADHMIATAEATVATVQIGNATAYVATPSTMLCPDAVSVVVHGGGWATMGGAYAKALAARHAAEFGCTAWSVDYRKPPHHPFPAAVDDVVAVYRALLSERSASAIFMSGPSAGGNLVAAAVLAIRSAGLPVPGAIGLFTPVVDMTQGSDTVQTNMGIDNMLRRPLDPMIELYAGGHPLDDPLLSPLFGALDGFPPTFLQTGTRDVLLSDTVRMHRALLRAGVTAELQVWEAMPHGGFGGFTPEDREMMDCFKAFVQRHVPKLTSATVPDRA